MDLCYVRTFHRNGKNIDICASIWHIYNERNDFNEFASKFSFAIKKSNTKKRREIKLRMCRETNKNPSNNKLIETNCNFLYFHFLFCAFFRNEKNAIHFVQLSSVLLDNLVYMFEPMKEM